MEYKLINFFVGVQFAGKINFLKKYLLMKKKYENSLNVNKYSGKK